AGHQHAADAAAAADRHREHAAQTLGAQRLVHGEPWILLAVRDAHRPAGRPHGAGHALAALDPEGVVSLEAHPRAVPEHEAVAVGVLQADHGDVGAAELARALRHAGEHG